MSIRTENDPVNGVHFIFDSECAAPASLTIWVGGRDLVVIPEPFESPSDVWKRALGEVKMVREALRLEARRRGVLLAHYTFCATVFAGVLPTEEQKRERHRARIVAGLLDVANTAEDGASRVRALEMARELLGMVPPDTVYVTVPLHEQIKAEIARRKAARRQPQSDQ